MSAIEHVRAQYNPSQVAAVPAVRVVVVGVVSLRAF
jgi:hypothetical protein